VSLSPKLRDKVGAGDTLFVVAKAPDGKGPPLAVWKHQGKDFPVEFRLDDNAAIIPGRVISQFAEVLLSAKISKSGAAESANGDILAPAVKARVGTTMLKLELSELVSGK
jgi:cytochrome c-type biogenesis protein CcmH